MPSNNWKQTKLAKQHRMEKSTKRCMSWAATASDIIHKLGAFTSHRIDIRVVLFCSAAVFCLTLNNTTHSTTDRFSIIITTIMQQDVWTKKKKIQKINLKLLSSLHPLAGRMQCAMLVIVVVCGIDRNIAATDAQSQYGETVRTTGLLISKRVTIQANLLLIEFILHIYETEMSAR